MINPKALSHQRTRCGLSQRALARQVGLNYQVIRRLEAGGDDGNLTLRDFDRICRALAVSPALLIAAAELPSHEQAPRVDKSAEELSATSAKLLRRIQQGLVPNTLTRTERELILPSLLTQDLIQTGSTGRPDLSSSAWADLAGPV